MANNSELLARLNNKSQLIQKKHSKELFALEMKIKRNWIEICKQRQNGIQMISKWYNNKKQDIIQKYKQKLLILERQSPIIRMEIKSQISKF